jgi:uncharacterized protein YciI
MKRLFVVTRNKGKGWDATKPMSSQVAWPEHATFMDDLADNRFVILGGPLDEGETTLLMIDAANEAEIRSTLAQDPWSKSGLLELQSIQSWTVLLQAGPAIRAMSSPAQKKA